MSRVVIVGGGPAGLAAAVELRRCGVDEVVVLDREAQAGGVPRHCAHTGFGLRDLHRMLGGPAYAARWTERAARAGVVVRTQATATGWAGSTALQVTSPQGIETLDADAVLLATGCRERPRSARLVPGTRPAGIFTTGSAQQLVHLLHARIGRRAVVVGAEHVSFSAVLTLREIGCETIAMVTEHAHHQSYAPLAWVAAGRHRVPILASSRVAEIRGGTRVDAVVLDDGRTLACDTVVFTGDWIPDHELARRVGVAIDPGTRGPRVDPDGRTSMRGVFAAGNLVHAAETADVAALGGRRVAAAIAELLRTGRWPDHTTPVECEAPVHWVSPNALTTSAAYRGPFLLRVAELLPHARLRVTQGNCTLWHGPPRRLIPNRSIRIPGDWVAAVEASADPPRIGIDR